ncbi:MAG: hypothetical protein ACREQV_07565 [Candidatus Binatia bacterium]
MLGFVGALVGAALARSLSAEGLTENVFQVTAVIFLASAGIAGGLWLLEIARLDWKRWYPEYANWTGKLTLRLVWLGGWLAVATGLLLAITGVYDLVAA